MSLKIVWHNKLLPPFFIYVVVSSFTYNLVRSAYYAKGVAEDYINLEASAY